ncbi:MAG: porin family protein [Oceanicaulis sp.]
MKTILLSTAAALIAASAASAQDAAESKFELGAGYTLLDGDGVEFDALTLRGGYNVNEFFAVEGEALFGLGDENLGGGFSAELNYGLGVFAKAEYPVGERVSVFGRLGYTWAEVEVSGLGSEDADGFAYGVGGEFAVSGPNAIRADYTRYDYEDGAEADGWSIAYVRSF